MTGQTLTPVWHSPHSHYRRGNTFKNGKRLCTVHTYVYMLGDAIFLRVSDVPGLPSVLRYILHGVSPNYIAQTRKHKGSGRIIKRESLASSNQ